MSDTDLVTTEVRGRLLLIGLNRPDKRNAANQALLQQLARAYRVLHEDSDLRVGVVFAHGDHFTGGLDLADVAPRLASGELDLLGGGIDPWGMHTEPCAKPVVVAVQGVCFTLGIELALASEVTVAARGTRFAQVEVARGILPFGGATLRFPRLAWGDAMRYLLTGDEFDAAEALRMGVVQQVVPDGEQLDAAIAIAERIAAQAPLAVQATLASARLATRDAAAAIDELMPTVQRLSTTRDARRAAESYLTKQPVEFQGD